MHLDAIEELRREYVIREDEELQTTEATDLHREMFQVVKHKEVLEFCKKEYSGRINDTLKVVKARLKQITDVLDERGF